MKHLLFSASFGMYSKYDFVNTLDNWDLVIFTDNISNISAHPCWTVKQVVLPFSDFRKSNRYYKWMIHKLLPEYDYVFYFDSKWNLKSCILKYPAIIFRDNIFFKHFARSCIYTEAMYVLKCKKESKQNINFINDYLSSHAFPKNYGLTENSIFARQTTNVDLNNLCEGVFNFMDIHNVKRDQLCFMYFLWKLDLKRMLFILNHSTKECDFISHKVHKKFIK